MMMKELPIGPKTRKIARDTKAGELARCLHEILYNGVVKEEERYGKTRRVFVVDNEQYVGTNRKYPFTVGTNTIDVEKCLREIRDYLDFEALSQVIP